MDGPRILTRWIRPQSLALVAMAIHAGCDSPSSGRPTDFEQLAAQLAAPRDLLLRSAGTAFRHCRPVDASSVSFRCVPSETGVGPPADLSAFWKRHLGPSAPEAENLHLRALWTLAFDAGESAHEATALLKRAAQMTPQDPAVWNDLAVARVRSFEAERDPVALFRAAEDLETALSLDPDSIRARWNLACVLTAIGLQHQAVGSWKRYLELDAAPDWRAEAQVHLARLAERDPVSRWSKLKASIRSDTLPATSSELEAELADLLQQGRQLAVRGLLRDIANGDSAALNSADKLAALLVDRNGDWLLHDALESLRRSRATQPTSSMRAAYEVWLRGLDSFDRSHLEAARLDFVDAQRQLSDQRSPLALWVEYYLAVLDYFDGEYETAIHRLGTLIEKEERYPSLAARCRWLLGLCQSRRGNFFAKAEQHRIALASYERLNERENAAAVDGMLSEVYGILGDVETSRVHRLAALRGLGSVTDPRRRHNILYEFAAAARHEGMPRLALRIYEEMVSFAIGVEDPTYELESRMWKSQSLQDLGMGSKALDEIGLAEKVNDRLEVGPVRDHSQAELLLARAELEEEVDPSGALLHLERAEHLYSAIGLQARLPELFLRRAESHKRLGQRADSVADLAAGIQWFESTRQRVPADDLRASYFDASRELFDLIVPQLLDQGEIEEAWRYVERSRSRVLLDALASSDGFMNLSELQSYIPEDLAILEYAVLKHETVLWVIRHDRTAFHRLELSEARVHDLVSSVVEKDPDQETRRHIAESVLGPARESLRGSDRLVIVPDKLLHRLPFAVLPMGEGQLLLQTHAISIAPSASLWLAAHQNADRRRRSGWPPRSVLAIGVAGSPALPHSRRLESAPREAEQIGALYPSATILLEEQATQGALLTSLAGAEVLHIASHAVVNPRFPYLSFLALGDTGTVEGGDDSALFAHELYGTTFEDLALVVLAACATAEGPIAPTEGPATLARPFLTGGVPYVLATLRAIDDEIASQILTSFHGHLLDGNAPPAALRLAQVEFLGKNGLTSVYDIETFVVLGAD